VESFEVDEKTPINLYFLGDFHIGNKGCRVDEIKRAVLRIKEDKNGRAIIMGDLVEGISPRDPRFNIDEISTFHNTVTRQYIEAREILMSIKDKIYGVIEGNHEYKIRTAGHDVIELISEDLGVPNLREGAIIRITVAGKLYRVLAIHGATNAGTLAGQINSLMKFAFSLSPLPEIIITGHHHRLDVISHATMNDVFKVKVSFFGISGSFLSGYQGGSTYASRAYFTPHPQGYLCFHFTKDSIMPEIIYLN